MMDDFSDPPIDNDELIRDHHLPWVEKYRPSTLSEIISHDNITNTLRKFMISKTMPNLLLHGPSGTGKTSTIISCAKELYGKKYNYMVLELNTSDSRGIETVRNKIKTFVGCRNQFYIPLEDQNIFQLAILDETDAMTPDAQAILKQIMECYSETTRFCLICNHINKISVSLQSRCCKFKFKPLKIPSMVKRLEEISNSEGVKYTQNALETIVKISGGDMRKAINILQTTFMTYDVIKSKYVYYCSSYCQPKQIKKVYQELINVKLTGSIKTTFDNINKIFENDKYSIYHLVYNIKDLVINSNDLTDKQKINIIIELAKLEIQIAVKVDNLKLMNLITIFILNLY
jgi:replication factor C subunit 3/5